MKRRIDRAAAIVSSYRTAVTLRQVFYRLVSKEAIPNTENAYKHLSRLTARARREGTFPPLADATREIWHPGGWTSPQQAIRDLAAHYRRPRDEHQTHQLWIAYEKRTLTAQVRDWFGDYGPRFVALAGYESETLDRQITTNVQQDGRPAVVVYAGDLDPSGEDIWRSFLKYTGRLWDQAQRVAVTWEQVETHQLPVLPGKTIDSRAKGFAATHGRLAQIEVEALDPNDLHNIYTHTINQYIDMPWSSPHAASILGHQTRSLWKCPATGGNSTHLAASHRSRTSRPPNPHPPRRRQPVGASTTEPQDPPGPATSPESRGLVPRESGVCSR